MCKNGTVPSKQWWNDEVLVIILLWNCKVSELLTKVHELHNRWEWGRTDHTSNINRQTPSWVSTKSEESLMAVNYGEFNQSLKGRDFTTFLMCSLSVAPSKWITCTALPKHIVMVEILSPTVIIFYNIFSLIFPPLLFVNSTQIF